MKVNEVIIGVQSENSACLESLMRIIKGKDIKLLILESGMKINVDKNCFFDVLWPKRNELIEENGLNNNSLVLKFTYNNFSILFTGDIEEIAENEILKMYKEKLKCNILKVAHHGSKTSSIKEFLDYAKPEIALIGVGKDNKFFHPSKITVENLNKINCKILRTDLYGEIILKIKKEKIFIKTKLN